jgi:hypothetical protein
MERHTAVMPSAVLAVDIVLLFRTPLRSAKSIRPDTTSPNIGRNENAENAITLARIG